MRKVILYIAMSLDGKIARAHGEINWLEQIPNPEGDDYGYHKFLDRVDTTIMGNSTYRQICTFPIPFPYSGKKNYVLTKNKEQSGDENATFLSSDILDTIKALRKTEGKDIWLIGGAEINTLLHNADLIDEYMISVMPIVLGDGISLFSGNPNLQSMSLMHSKVYSSGVVLMHYEAAR